MGIKPFNVTRKTSVVDPISGIVGFTEIPQSLCCELFEASEN